MSTYPFSADLIQRLMKESDNEDSLTNAVGSAVSPTHALLVAVLCWPRFVRYRGLVLVGPGISPYVDDWVTKLDGCAFRVEAVVNHVHIWDVFHSVADGDDAQFEAMEELGKGLPALWAAAALAQVPDIPMVVEYQGGEDDYGPTVYCYRRNQEDRVS
jgi:hypothetical protein